MNNDKSLSEILDDAEIFTDGDWIESKDQDKEGSVRLTQLADVGDGYWVDKSARFLTEEKAVKLRCTILKKGDLLIARMPDPLGRCCIFPGDRMQCVTVVDVCIVRPNSERVFGRYLMHAINAPIGRRGIAKHITGTTRQRISRRNLGKVEIPLPPLAEQKRIAGILDAADALRAKRKQALAHLDDLLQSTFLTLFGDPVTNPMGWDDSKKLVEIAEISSGITKGRKVKEQSLYEIPYLAVANVQDKSLKLEKVKTILATKVEIERYELRENDLLLTEGGDPDKLGRGSLWRSELPKCIHQNHIFRVRVIDPIVEPLFLNWIVGSQRGKRYFLRKAKQTTGIASINITQLKGFPLIVPPLPLQQRFAAIVETIEVQKSRHRAHLAELDTLFGSLQSRAFSGEL